MRLSRHLIGVIASLGERLTAALRAPARAGSGPPYDFGAGRDALASLATQVKKQRAEGFAVDELAELTHALIVGDPVLVERLDPYVKLCKGLEKAMLACWFEGEEDGGGKLSEAEYDALLADGVAFSLALSHFPLPQGWIDG